jgi:hypothetical protein
MQYAAKKATAVYEGSAHCQLEAWLQRTVPLVEAQGHSYTYLATFFQVAPG